MLLLITAVLVFISGAAAKWEHCHVKFGIWDSFYSIPLSISEINSIFKGEYTKSGEDEDLGVSLYSYPSDPRFHIMYDCCSNIAGLRICYVKKDIPKQAIENGVNFEDYWSYEDKKMFSSRIYWDTDCWCNDVLFVSPENLNTCRNDSNCPVAEDVWLNLDGAWTNISKEECGCLNQGFFEQACFVGMGKHYYWKTSPATECKDIPGVFLLYESGYLIGLGLIPFGSFTYKDREWNEHSSVWINEMIVPNRPDCMSDLLKKLGMIGLHIFFKKYPALTICTWPWQKDDRCIVDSS